MLEALGCASVKHGSKDDLTALHRQLFVPAVQFSSSVPAIRREITEINVEPGEAGIIVLLANTNFFLFSGKMRKIKWKLKSNF